MKNPDIEFKKALREYLTPLQKYARTFYPNRANANDLVQDTVLRALEKQDQYQEGTNLKAWLFTIMRSIYINNYNHRVKFRKVDVDNCNLSSTPNYDEVLRFKKTAEAFNGLPLKYREVLFLATVEGLSYEEIAANLNIKTGTVKSRINRARAELQSKAKKVKLQRRRQNTAASAPVKYGLNLGAIS